MNIRLARTLNLTIGIAMILAFNAVGSLPAIPHGVQHEVGPETVSVYTSKGEPHEILTPVETHDASERGFIDTGQKVQVYVRNDYNLDLSQYYPRWTFVITLCMVAIHLATLLWKPHRAT